MDWKQRCAELEKRISELEAENRELRRQLGIRLPEPAKPAPATAVHMEQSGASYKIDDQTCPGKPIRVTFKGTLRDEQQPAADALLAHNNGVLSATTAFGKTVVAAYLISQRKVNTLILVHTQALLNQWKRSLSEFLEIDETLQELPKKRGRKKERSVIGQLGGSKDNLSGFVDIAIMQSLISESEVR